MKFSVSDARALWTKAQVTLTSGPGVKYAVAIAVSLAFLAFRAVFDPVLSPGAYYFIYYPGVVLIAYLLGMGPSFVAIILMGSLSYLMFSQPALAMKTDLRANLRLVLFFGSAATLAFVIARIRTKLERLNNKLSDASVLARAQADLFREHAERVAGHLQLLSAVLQLRAQDETDVDYSRVLMNAASRTMLISRIHRSFASLPEEVMQFSAFAERLSDAALEARGRPPLVVSVEGELALLPEQATSLALVLLECVNARAEQGSPGHVRISLSQRSNEGVLSVSEASPPANTRLTDTPLLRAIAEQMGGRLLLGKNNERAMVHFAFPMHLQPLPTWNPLAPLH